MTNTAWAALITRLPAADDLPLTMLLELIETSAADLNTRTGNDIANALSVRDRACCRSAAALTHAQPLLTDATGHNACQSWASHRVTAAGIIYRRHAHDVLTEINANPFIYLHTHPPQTGTDSCPEPAEKTGQARGPNRDS